MMDTKVFEVDFESTDGVRLFGTKLVPSAKPKAFVLMVHGITADRSEWGVFDQAAEALGRRGISSFRFDYRGHGKSLCPSSKMSLAQIREDIIAAWAELDEGASDARNYILGSSFGGGLAYNAASSIGGFSRAFLLAPVFDYVADIKNSAPHWEQDIARHSTLRYGEITFKAEILKEAAQFQSIPDSSQLNATIFHGTQDEDVPITSSRSAAEKHPSVQLVEVEGAGHVIAAPGDLDMVSDRTWQLVESVIGQITDRIVQEV